MTWKYLWQSPLPNFVGNPKLKNHLHHNANNVSQTNYCKWGHLHFFIIIVHVKSALRAIAQTEYISKHTSDLAGGQTN